MEGAFANESTNISNIWTHLNKKIEEQLQVVATETDIAKQVTVQEHHEGEQCLVVGDSII